MTFYVQIDTDGYITDCITYKYDNYIECDFETPLPDKFIAGCYKLINSNTFKRDDEKYQELINKEK